MINTLPGKTQNLEIMAETLLHNAYRMAPQVRVNLWMKGKTNLGTVKGRKGRRDEGERQTENVCCIDLPAVSGANSSWPWCKTSYGGKLHVALLGFHTPCTVSYSTKRTRWLSLNILPFLSDRERGKIASDRTNTLAMGLQWKYQHHQHLQIWWCINVLSTSLLLRKL
jgi:hypothetical protein